MILRPSPGKRISLMFGPLARPDRPPPCQELSRGEGMLLLFRTKIKKKAQSAELEQYKMLDANKKNTRCCRPTHLCFLAGQGPRIQPCLCASIIKETGLWYERLTFFSPTFVLATKCPSKIGSFSCPSKVGSFLAPIKSGHLL